MIYPKFSVVMAVYRNDSAKHFEEALESLLKQTIRPSEIILVVDGWIDKILENAIGKFVQNEKVLVIRNDSNKGLAYSLNRGVAAASTDFIARMDSDDICLPMRFEIQLSHLIENQLDCVGGQILEFGKDLNDILYRRLAPITHDAIVNRMKVTSAFNHPTVIYKRDAFEKIGGYSIDIFPEDVDFFVRMNLAGYSFGNVPEIVLYFRVGEDYNEMLRRRWGLDYAIKELKLYKNYYRIGFYNLTDLFLAVILKVPLRLLPFFLFKNIYILSRKS
jgi:glycosyltransferase involved in cell wall biosynthesis